jgi:hypothetical protein
LATLSDNSAKVSSSDEQIKKTPNWKMKNC